MANGGIVYVDQDTRQLSVTDGSGTLRRHLGVPGAAELATRVVA